MCTVNRQDLIREYRRAHRAEDYDYATEIAWAFESFFNESIFDYV